MNAPARFVVGTGRCGSTLLSRMLSENAQVLNVFELFSGIDQFFRFERRDISVVVLVCGQRVLLNPKQSFPCDQDLQQIDFAELEGAA